MALPPIPTGDARKIVGCLALLRSPHDGEVVAAARAVERLLKPYGLHVDAIAEAALGSQQAVARLPAPTFHEFHQQDAQWCLKRTLWNAKETDFLTRMANQATITPRQRSWLNDLCDRRGGAA